MQISKVIKEHGYKLADVAAQMGVSRGSFANTIGGENPEVKTLRRIAEIIGCSITEFFADEAPGQSATTTQAARMTALIDYDGEMYRADDLDSLQGILDTLRKKSKA